MNEIEEIYVPEPKLFEINLRSGAPNSKGLSYQNLQPL